MRRLPPWAHFLWLTTGATPAAKQRRAGELVVVLIEILPGGLIVAVWCR
jgi:hypothetical protein